jgi:hypothetical protein
MSPIDDLKKARLILVEQRRYQVSKLISGGPEEAARWGPGITQHVTWIEAIDRAIEDEEKSTSGDAPAMTARFAASRRRPA